MPTSRELDNITVGHLPPPSQGKHCLLGEVADVGVSCHRGAVCALPHGTTTPSQLTHNTHNTHNTYNTHNTHNTHRHQGIDSPQGVKPTRTRRS
jgi:hypothetical protein